jgi:serine acetyltransferase
VSSQGEQFWSKAGAGTVVVKDIPARYTVLDNPARMHLQHDEAGQVITGQFLFNTSGA